MRVSAIKKELDERGVGYRGLFEKSVFVELLVDARAKGITAPPPGADVAGGDAAGEGDGSGEKTGEKDGFDPSYKEVEVCWSRKEWERGEEGRHETRGGTKGPLA